MSKHAWHEGDAVQFSGSHCSGYDQGIVETILMSQQVTVRRIDGSVFHCAGLSLQPAPRTVEQITQEAVEDFLDGYWAGGSGFVGSDTITNCDAPHNLLAAIIEAAIYAGRAERAR